jgi:hypothetical protein
MTKIENPRTTPVGLPLRLSARRYKSLLRLLDGRRAMVVKSNPVDESGIVVALSEHVPASYSRSGEGGA